MSDDLTGKLENKVFFSFSNPFLWLVVFFSLIAALRIFLAFFYRTFDYSAFDLFRQVQSIYSSGFPLFHDPLSFGGRDRVFIPVFYYFMAFLNLFFSKTIIIKVIPNLVAASVVFPSFLLLRHITNNDFFSVLTSLLVGLVPAGFFIGVNDGSSVSFTLPLMIWVFYLFVKSKKAGRHLNWLLVLLIIIGLTDWLSVVLLFTLVFYFIIVKVQGLKLTGKEEEIVLFFLFFTSWVFLVVFKKALLFHGSSILWLNVPSAEINNVFARIGVVDAILSSGLVPLILSSFSYYHAFFSSRKKSLFLLISFSFVPALALWFRIIELRIGLLLLSVSLALLGGFGLSLINDYFLKTKFSFLSKPLILLIVFFFVIISLLVVLPPVLNNVPNNNIAFNRPLLADESVLLWARNNIPANSTIVGMPEEGSMISYLSGLKNVIDDDYLLVNRADERYNDVMSIYKARFKIDAVRLMEKYGADYLLVTRTAALRTGVEIPLFLLRGDNDCFRLVKQEKDPVTKQLSRLYERTCSLRVIT